MSVEKIIYVNNGTVEAKNSIIIGNNNTIHGGGNLIIGDGNTMSTSYYAVYHPNLVCGALNMDEDRVCIPCISRQAGFMLANTLLKHGIGLNKKQD